MQLNVVVSGLILVVASASSVQAQVTIDVSKITCDQFVHSKISSPSLIAAWLSGYYNAKQNIQVIDTQALQDNMSKLQHYCEDGKNFKVPAMTAVEDMFGKKKK
jgi:acid stress chaperone HdeB